MSHGHGDLRAEDTSRVTALHAHERGRRPGHGHAGAAGTARHAAAAPEDRWEVWRHCALFWPRDPAATLRGAAATAGNPHAGAARSRVRGLQTPPASSTSSIERDRRNGGPCRQCDVIQGCPAGKGHGGGGNAGMP